MTKRSSDGAPLTSKVRTLTIMSAPLADQDVVVTVPASFDEVARELTVDAAREAGLPGVRLIEEPQAAFYDFLGAHADGTTAGPIFGVFFWANGLPWHAGMGGETAGVSYPDLWTPGSTGVGYAPSELLMPLSRHSVSVVTGLEPKTAVPGDPPGQGDGHMRGFMVAMTGDRIRPEGFDHPSHTLTALRPTLD